MKKAVKPTNRKFNEDELFGELDDPWAKPTEIKSKNHHEYVTGFAKLDMIPVKAVINPVGG